MFTIDGIDVMTMVGADTSASAITDADMSTLKTSFTEAGNNALKTEIQFVPVFLGIAVIGLAVYLIFNAIGKVKTAGRR